MKKKKRRRKVDTSISGYSFMGVQISQERLSDLACINSMMRSGALEDTPVHAIIYADTVKALAALVEARAFLA